MQDFEFQERDEDFLIQNEERLNEFLESSEETMHFEPMNSYFRRLVHQQALRFHFKSQSEGSEDNRHVVIAKTKKSKAPEKIKRKEQITWNFGDREFLVDPLAEEVAVYLGKDGSVGLYDESVRDHIATKNVVSGAFKVKMNKIVELLDDEW